MLDLKKVRENLDEYKDLQTAKTERQGAYNSYKTKFSNELETELVTEASKTTRTAGTDKEFEELLEKYQKSIASGATTEEKEAYKKAFTEYQNKQMVADMKKADGKATSGRAYQELNALFDKNKANKDAYTKYHDKIKEKKCH